MIEKQFAEMGARVSVREVPGRRSRISIDVRRDRNGEYFVVNAADGVNAEVVNVDREGRHLLLHVNDEGTKSKFLCGHDERHWFVAAVPESAPGVTTVAKAKEALQPDSVKRGVTSIRKKNRLRRRNAAYIRQGEWFFTPAPDFEPDTNLIHRNEPITRGRGKPHIVEYLYRSPGRTVYTAPGVVISEEEFFNLGAEGRKRRSWTSRTEVQGAWAKGRVSHPDHATIMLDGWHFIEMNTEQRARAMSHVAFID